MRILLLWIAATLILFTAMMLSLSESSRINYPLVCTFFTTCLYTMWRLVRSEISREDKDI